MAAGELTGRHVAMIFIGFFGTIFAVNGLLAYKAISTFPGLEVKNGYIASQEFNRRLADQTRLGWKIWADERDGQVILSITGRDGAPVEVADLTAIVGRATEEREDVTPDFRFDGTVYVAPLELAGGNWNIRMVAHAQDGTEFRQRVILHVKR